ncbi:MAG: lipoprotein-releasing ABC transporter permease subunit [Bauldia sp.]|nr:lipoprotein-releasing ABC transporter permease subunit [Bauldia sp.]
MVAFRYLRPRRRQAFISVVAGFSLIGIILGVATLIIVLAVMNGFRAELFDRILGINGHFVIQPIDSQLTDYDEVAQRIATVDGVVAAIPRIEGQVLASGPVASLGALVRGVREQDLPLVPGLVGNVRLGSLDGFDQSPGVAVGSRLAASLGLTLGDRIQVISPEGDVTPMGVSPRSKSYPIVAIFEIGMSEYDGILLFMPFPEAQIFFNVPGVATDIEVYIEDPDAIDALRPAVEEAAARPLFMTDWRQRNLTFFSALEVERNVMFLILTLIILVAALNIISGLIMLVKEKGRDIAILRTIGTTRGAVLRVFFIIGASIGTVGTLLGLLLGTVITFNIEPLRQFVSRLTGTEVFAPELYYLSFLPADMDPGETVAVVLMGLGLSYLATIYPAWRAARLDPVEALRYE